MKISAASAAFAALLSIAAPISAQVLTLQENTTIQPSIAVTYAIDQNAFVHIFAGNFAPAGLGAADGRLVNIATNIDLFTLVGTTYGGDGVTTFGLPNLSGRVAVGSGTGPGLSTTGLGDINGSESMFLGHNQFPIGAGGLAQPFNNLQPELTLNYIISNAGVFPSHPDPTFPSATPPNFLGEIALFAGNIAPAGWRFADGSLLTISSNTALFSLLGTTFGGDGRTNFALPDLRGRTPIGTGTGPGLTTRDLGERLGTETTTLNNGNIPAVMGGLGLPYDNMQPSLGINFMMSPTGIFPARDPGPINFETQLAPFVSEIFMFGGNFTPAGYVPTNGQLIPISSNTALFSLLGTNFGGDGRATFALPDLRGRVLLGAGSGPGLSTYEVGQTVGVESVFLTASPGPIDPPPPPTAVPEPATFVYVALCGLALIARRVLAAKKKNA
jgi:microcystin-dependent protein